MCEKTLPGEVSYDEAIQARWRAGWIMRYVVKTGKFLDMCRECLEEERDEQEHSEETQKAEKGAGQQYVCSDTAPEVRQVRQGVCDTEGHQYPRQGPSIMFRVPED
jgi:hypothetical protein